VMAAAHLRGDAIVSGGRAHAVDLVGGDAHADAGAADQDAAIDSPLAHCLGHLKGVIRVIDALTGRSTDIENFVTEILYEGHEPALDLEAAMIAADGYFHVSRSVPLSPGGRGLG